MKNFLKKYVIFPLLWLAFFISCAIALTGTFFFMVFILPKKVYAIVDGFLFGTEDGRGTL